MHHRLQIPTVFPTTSPTALPTAFTTTKTTSTVFPTVSSLANRPGGTLLPAVIPTTESALTSEYELVIQEEAEQDASTNSLAEFFIQR